MNYHSHGKEYDNLLKAGISGGKWLDAGAGYGAYTLPLAHLVDQVLALDISSGNIARLKETVKRIGLQNVTAKQGDMRDLDNYSTDLQGVLFAFSLHYQPDIEFLKSLLQVRNLQKDFKLVIIEYTRSTPVPWVPYPQTIEKLTKMFMKLHKKVILQYQTERFYILTVE